MGEKRRRERAPGQRERDAGSEQGETISSSPGGEALFTAAAAAPGASPAVPELPGLPVHPQRRAPSPTCSPVSGSKPPAPGPRASRLLGTSPVSGAGALSLLRQTLRGPGWAATATGEPEEKAETKSPTAVPL